MKTSHISKQEIQKGEDIKGQDLREGIFNLIKSDFPDFDKDHFITILGILFAPDKGKNTRKQILSRGEDFVDGVKKKFDSEKRNVAEYADEKKAKYAGIKKDLSHAGSDVKHTAY